ncbi:glutamine synthetase family protein [Butyrivibrio sp. MC2013]|uniref:glutamine synthetase family protein n=1 Tax=Butyrivibrio sp. MC2013 TaxID=1280686 RepID=UPI0004011469|nr:glutamine synthetase family protein [Butyrivibrio sp. MC2013]
MSGYSKKDIIKMVEEEDIAFIRLQFCDAFGTAKNIAITPGQLEAALSGKISFITSGVEGFSHNADDELYLRPDTSTFEIYPWRPQTGRVARMFCMVEDADKKSCATDPRHILKSVCDKAAKMGIRFEITPELEFFLLTCDDNGLPVAATAESAGYLDVAPSDWGENVRRDIILNLEKMNFNVISSHHESAPAQHEIDFEGSDPCTTSDMIQTFKMAVKTIARKHGCYATFMPKPREGYDGSGLHLHIRAFDEKGNNIFAGQNDDLSPAALSFITGLCHHMNAISLVSNPLVNSYKRLISGYEAPTGLSWTQTGSNHTSMIRIPKRKGIETSIELRNPDATCNPYLAIALCLAAGLEGIEKSYSPCPSAEVARSMNLPIEDLPQTLGQSIEAFKADPFARDIMGKELADIFITAKENEWKKFRSCVTQWEMKEYLGKY